MIVSILDYFLPIIIINFYLYFESSENILKNKKLMIYIFFLD